MAGQQGQGRKNGEADLAIIHLTFEGIQTFGGGVATVTRGHLAALPRVKAALHKEGIRLTPYFAEIAYRADHPRRDGEFEKKAAAALAGMGGQLQYLVNYSQGLVPQATWGVGDIGTIENWKAASASGAAAALNMARRHSASVIYCHDIVFALAPLYATLQEAAFAAGATAIYVIHSTALTHELPLPNPERLMAESATVHWCKVNSACKLGYISGFIADHIVKDYGARTGDLVPTGNGVNPQDSYFRQRGKDEIEAKLRAYGVPLDEDIVFSWGRPVAYKRYDVTLRAAAELKGRVRPVVMVSPEWPELKTLADELGLKASLVGAFDPEFVACMLQWDRTVAAASLAYREPFGLTPIEVRMLARQQGPLMVVSDTGGLIEQVKDGIDGFVTKQDDPHDVAKVLDLILTMPPEERQRIRRAGLEIVLHQYTWSSQILRTLAAVFPRWEEHFQRIRDRLANEDLRALGLQAREA